MKQTYKTLCTILAMFYISISAYAYDFVVDGIAYTITYFSDLTCAISSSDEAYKGELTLPSEVLFNGKTLTVTSISSGAFRNSQVTSVHLAETIVEIGESAFANCENLSFIDFKEGLKTIGNDAFNGCVNLLNIDFPNTLNTIGSAGFANCKSLSQLKLSTNITSIGSACFMNCENVIKVLLSNNISVLESDTFKGCIHLNEIEWGNNLQEIRDYAFADCGFITFIIPNTVKTIGESIVSNNQSLQSFTIGNGINIISSDPIAQCPNVKELIIADGSNPLTLDFSAGGYSYKETYNRFFYYFRPGAYSSASFDTVYVGRTLTNPYLEKDIYDNGNRGYGYYYTLPPFHGNKTLKNITIGLNVAYIDGVYILDFFYGWLEGCSNLESLKIYGLERIPKSFVKDVITLKTVEIPNTTLSIGENSFENCISLETIILGSKLSKIESNALKNCSALKYIYCKSTTPPSYTTGFIKDIYLNCNLYIPFDTEQTYRSVSPWNNFWNMSESLECVSEFVVGDLIYSVTAGNKVIVSGNIITDECDIVIPSHVKYYATEYNVVGIGESSFKGAPIKSIVIPGSISNIYNDAFSGCGRLKSITLEYSDNAVMMGNKSSLQLSNSIVPYPNASTVDEKRTGFRNGYYDGIFYGLPIEHLVVNRDIELPKYYERTMGNSTSSYSTVYNDIIYYPPFYGLTNLKYVEIGENVSAICKNQIEAVVNAVPTTMEYTNFGKCDNIEVVVSNNPIAPIGGCFSQTVYEQASLFLPNGGIDSYMNDDYWKNFVHINFIPVESISFESDEVTIDVNESKKLNTVINPSEASIKTLKWSSSNTSIVNVSEDGVITSSSREGETIITAMTCDGTNVSASIKVNVQEGAGIADVFADDKLDIRVENGKLHIRGKADMDIVSIYNVQGQLILSTSDNEIELCAKGIYIIKVGSVSKMVTI